MLSLQLQAWHGDLGSKLQELQEFHLINTGGYCENIGGFYEDTGEFHQFQKYRRDWPVLQELQEIQEVVPGL